MASNPLLSKDLQAFGSDAFFFFALRIDGFTEIRRQSQFEGLEAWFANQMGAADEQYGYNLEAGHQRSRASKFRDRERKLMRRNSEKYRLLPGVNLLDPVNPRLLESWIPGS